MRDAESEFESRYDVLLGLGYRAAYRLLGERAAAEDAASEALARAFSRWRSVRGHAEPWVVTVATNLALDVGRARRRAMASRWELVEDVAPDPQVELRLDLQRALGSLPRRQREVITLRYLGDFTEQATAEALGLDIGTVKTHASRGLAKLRTQMERV